jgi:hypothetical protein
MRLSGVPEFLDERVSVECLLNDPSLNAFSTTMNESDFAQTCLMGSGHVFVDHGRDVAWREGM